MSHPHWSEAAWEDTLDVAFDAAEAAMAGLQTVPSELVPEPVRLALLELCKWLALELSRKPARVVRVSGQRGFGVRLSRSSALQIMPDGTRKPYVIALITHVPFVALDWDALRLQHNLLLDGFGPSPSNPWMDIASVTRFRVCSACSKQRYGRQKRSGVWRNTFVNRLREMRREVEKVIVCAEVLQS